MNCKNVLGFSDLIPLFSWLILKGRCRYCQASISFRYPFIETLCSILFVLCIFASPSSIGLTNEVVVLVAGWVLVSFLLALSFIDFDYLWLPSSLTLSAITSGIVFTSSSSLISLNNSNYIFIINNICASILGFLCFRFFGLFVKKIIKKQALGNGDAKLAAMAGAFLGLTGLEVTVVISILTSGLFSVFCLTKGILKRGDYIPFGPFMSISIFSVWLLGDDFWLRVLGDILWWRYL